MSYVKGIVMMVRILLKGIPLFSLSLGFSLYMLQASVHATGKGEGGKCISTTDCAEGLSCHSVFGKCGNYSGSRATLEQGW